MKIDHIVLTTDLSDESRRSFEPVCALAKRAGARVTLLHAIQTLTEPVATGLGTPIVPPDYQAETKSAESALEELAKTLSAGGKGKVKVVLGPSAWRSIIDFATEEGASLIAVSTHGRTGFRRLVMGSVAEQVLRHSPVPVLCFPRQEEEHKTPATIDHILLTTDLSDEALRPFGPVLELANELSCKVTVLHVHPELLAIPYGAPLAPPVSPPDLEGDMEKAREAVQAQCASLGAGVDLHCEVVHDEDRAKGIIEYAAENGVDLIALSSHGRTGFRRAAFGSVAEQVLRRSTVPVLSFHRVED